MGERADSPLCRTLPRAAPRAQARLIV